MVKTRFAADSESKMPVKDTSKDEPREEVDSPCMSGKDNSDFSSKTPKVWSRELRNRFVISSEKRSIRFTNDVVRSGRGLRSCRMALKSRQHFSLSQSDDDDDDRIFSACGPSKRLKHRMSKRHMHSDRSGVSSHDKDENPSTRLPYLRRKGISDIAGAGIRRSTRQRKLKYENYSDSWIVGAQTLVGYPMYGNSYASKGGRLGPLKEEVEGEDEEDDEDDDEKEGGDETEGDSEEADEEEEEEPKTISLQAHGVKVENNVINGQDEMPDDGAFEDMYSRVKRPRPTRRDIFQVQPRETRKRKSVRSSSSDESSSEERRPTLRERKLGVVESRKYCLRKTKPTVDRFVPEVAESRRESRALREAFHKSVRRRRRRRRASSSSSSNSSDNSDRRFDCKKPKARSRCLTSVGQETAADRSSKSNRTDGISANVGRLADLDPVTLDTSIRFSHVGGLEDHVRCLQEMVVFPMLYSEVFQKFHITPPKGVLFYGPPGTGKTLIARALANECSQGDHKVSFFMRKGADCLSKWVGESERQLRLLFEQAHRSRPSIIFFDEIDGLAPVRSAKQDQIHASIVSTLLALMDGLDDRGDIVVIGATNRIDAIDPALRRPGRFDRELLFPLPAIKERKEILRIHVSKWEKPPPPPLLNRLAEMTVGFCGSDLRALCTEAVIHGLRRKYPQIYKSSQKLLLDPDCVQVEKVDFDAAKKSIVPSSYRSAPAIACELPVYLHPLLNRPLTELTSRLNFSFPSGFQKCTRIVQITKSHRLLIVGQKSSGNKSSTLTHISAALLYAMEQCPVHTIDLATLFCQSSRSAEEACIQIFNEARRSVPSIIYVPKVSEWWDIVGNTVQVVFSTQLAQMNSLPILLLATAYDPLPSQLQNMFSLFRDEVYTIQPANEKEREDFFRPLIFKRALLPPRLLKSKVPIPELPLAPPPAPPKLTEQQLQHIYNDEENTLRELRIFLRQICSKLARNRQFFMFSKPVDVNEVPDYLAIIKEPMDLETMMTKIDLHKYTCAQDFLDDIDLLCRNALEYNPDRDPADKLIRHRACFLRDTAYALIKAEMDSDFEEQCRGIRDSRTKRAASPDRFVPDFVWTTANLPPNMTSTPMPSSSGVRTTLDNLTASNTNSNHSRRHDATASNHHVPLPSSSSSNTLNTNRSSGSSHHSQNITHNRLMRKRRHRNIWQKGLIRKKPAHWLSASHTVTSPHQVREKNKTEQTAAASGASSNVKKYIHNTRSSHSSDNQALSSFVSGSLSNGCTSIDKESPTKSTNPPKKRLREDCSSGTPRSLFGDEKDPVVNGIVDESLKEEATVNEVEMDVLVASSDEDDIEDEDDDILGESSQDDPRASSVNVTDSNSNAVSPKSSRNKSRLSDSSAANKRQVVINRSSLRKVLNDIIRATDNVSSFELLLDLYDKLKGLINSYIKSYNRTSLPSKLENEVKRFVECCASLNSSKHLSDGHNGSSGSERYNS